MGVSREVSGIPIVQYNTVNKIASFSIIKKTDFILIMTHFAKRDHLQLIKVLESYKLTDQPNFLPFTD